MKNTLWLELKFVKKTYNMKRNLYLKDLVVYEYLAQPRVRYNHNFTFGGMATTASSKTQVIVELIVIKFLVMQLHVPVHHL